MTTSFQIKKIRYRGYKYIGIIQRDISNIKDIMDIWWRTNIIKYETQRKQYCFLCVLYWIIFILHHISIISLIFHYIPDIPYIPLCIPYIPISPVSDLLIWKDVGWLGWQEFQGNIRDIGINIHIPCTFADTSACFSYACDLPSHRIKEAAFGRLHKGGRPPSGAAPLCGFLYMVAGEVASVAKP